MAMFNSIRGDIFGGLTAAIVALPLALAFGVASGLGPISGLYGAIAVGFFAAIFGGTSAQVSGPTGPMTVVMGAIVATHASTLPEAFGIIFLSGIFQIIFGFIRVGHYVSYTPYPVVSGFMSGIGIIIIIIQILPFVGLPTSAGGPMGSFNQWHKIFLDTNLDAFLLALLSLGIMIFWRGRVKSYLPPPLAALACGTLLGLYILSNAPVIGPVPTGLPQIYFPLMPIDKLLECIQPAFILALLGSIDSLLTSLVADSILRTRHQSNRELIGQGIGNMAAGLIGGLPGAGATMRTVVNIRAGGRTSISGAFHAIILLALALGLGPLVKNIPHAVLAGILVKVGWDIIDWKYLKTCFRAPKKEVFVMLVTVFLTVFVDLITAVACGLLIASFFAAQSMVSIELSGVSAINELNMATNLNRKERALAEKIGVSMGLISLSGHFSSFSARELTSHIFPVDHSYKIIFFDFTKVSQIDTSAAFSLEELIIKASDKGADLYIIGLSGSVELVLESLGMLNRFSAQNIANNLLDGLELVIKKNKQLTNNNK